MTFNWRDQDNETVEYHFNPRLSIPNAMDLLTGLPARSEAARNSLTANLDVRYGDRPKETLDIFHAATDALGSPPPVVIFIHGGYWRMMDKKDYSHIAADMVGEGISHISLNYDLCPSVTVTDIVDEIRTAIIYMYKNADSLKIDPDRIYLSGHSAGGHLTGMMLCEDWTKHGLPADVFKGAFPVSGVFDPSPIIRTSINEEVRLNDAIAEANNVLLGKPVCGGPVLAVVGGDEPEGFHRQSEEFAELCKANGVEIEVVSVDSTNHFTVVDEVFLKGGVLYDRFLKTVKG